ncbi:katanin p60 ATPase-containing subunit A1, partial [Biomphalaria glabrata]
MVYYQGVIQQIHRLMGTIKEPERKKMWNQLKMEIVKEYEQVQEINKTLQSFKVESGHGSNGAYSAFGGYDRGFNQDFQEPTRDPDVWPPPTPVEQRPSPNIRGQHKPTQYKSSVNGRPGSRPVQGQSKPSASVTPKGRGAPSGREGSAKGKKGEP